MTDSAEYARLLASGHLLRRGVMAGLVELLGVAAGQRVLDVGCGSGLVSAMLWDVVGPRGLVAGLDFNPGLLALAPGNAPGALFVHGDGHDLPFARSEFDLVLSVDCAGYPAAGRQAMVDQLREFGRALRPGGRAALAAWTSQRLLPGHAELEARLNLTTQGLAPYKRGMAADAVFDRGLGWLRSAGYREASMHVLAGTVQGPLDPEQRAAMLDLFFMRWGGSLGELGRSARAEYEALTRADSRTCILDEPDYAAFFTYTVFTGRWGAMRP